MPQPKAGETVLRTPGQIDGQQFLIDGAEDCVIRVLDNCAQVWQPCTISLPPSLVELTLCAPAQVTIDDAKKCEIVIGPCEDSLFVRDCEDCVVHAVCRQLRTRNCVRCKFFLWVLTEPVIESSHSLEFGEWHTSYPQLDAQFGNAKLDPAEPNLCKKIYDS